MDNPNIKLTICDYKKYEILKIDDDEIYKGNKIPYDAWIKLLDILGYEVEQEHLINDKLIKCTVIETNLLFNDEWILQDHQSRTIEVNSWREYVELFEFYYGEASGVDYKSSMAGNVLPSNSVIKNIKYDDFHLSCDIITSDGKISKKLAYLIK